MKVCLACNRSFTNRLWRCPHCAWEPPSCEGYLCFAQGLAAKSDGFPRVHADLAYLEQRCFWFRSRNKLLQWSLVKFFPGAASLFEIGCGTGFVLAGFAAIRPEMRLAGGELYLSALNHAFERVPQGDFIQVDACNLPYVNEFDVIGAFDVLEHIDEDTRVINQMHQAARPGGGIILTVPQHEWLWGNQDEFAYHKRRYSRKDLLTKIESSGFRVKWVTSFVTLLLPLMLMARLYQRWTDGSAEKLGISPELQLPTTLDLIMEKICDAERWFLTQGTRSLPLGGSLLVVATKA